MSSRPRRGIALGLVVALGALGASACDEGDAAGRSVPAVQAPTTTPARIDDGVLRIGVLLPRSGAAGGIGRPLSAAVDLAVQHVNEAGGVLGRMVEVTERDEGTTTASSVQAAQELIDADVDVVVGPASSRTAVGVLDQLVSAGVATCSPTASSLALDELPDGGLFVRTIPSDSMQAAALADQIEKTGQPTVAIGFLDDPYGRPLAAALQAEVELRKLNVVGSVGFAADDDDVSDIALRLLAQDPAVVAVVGDASSGMGLVAAAGSLPGGDDVTFFVNDAMRTPVDQAVLDDIRPTTLRNVRGVAPTATATEPELLAALGAEVGPYAVNAYDCATLFALATAQAGSDSPRAIAAAVTPVSSGGSACADFAGCAALLQENRNIDYNGPEGTVELSAEGDPTRARFDVFEFTELGVDQTIGSIVFTR